MIRHLSSEQLSAYLDGEVAVPESREIELHMNSCERCRDHFKSMQRAVSGVWRLERHAPPPDMAMRIRAEVEAASRPSTPVRSFVNYIFGLPNHRSLQTGAAMALALVIGIFVLPAAGSRRPIYEPGVQSDSGDGVVTVHALDGDPPLILPQTTSKVANREFVLTEGQDVWVQRGLEGEVPEARVSVQSPQGRELLTRYGELEYLLAEGARVVLRYRLETVELRGV